MIQARNTRLFFLCNLLLGLHFLAIASVSAGADDWLPISPEELKMVSEPKAAGAPAIYLYRQVDRDDANNREVTYERIKILTEEGRKYADVEIPFLKDRDNVRDIKARTVQPDGKVNNFDGKVYEKTVVKVKGVKYLAKTFSLPDVRIGSIIEYRYTDDMAEGWVYDSYWSLSSDLFTKSAKFSLKKAEGLGLRWSWPNGLPEGTQPPKDDRGAIRLEAQNIPAFQSEDYMPPERELKFRVDFVYESGILEKDPTKFWQQVGKSRFETDESFMNKRKAMEQALATIVQPSDDAETKLRKIYARAQEIRNYSFEKEKTEQEQKREKRKDLNNVEDVWKQSAGYGNEINYLFIALVRAAGMEAYHIRVSTRDSYFFNPGMMNVHQLNNDVVLVRLNGQDLYFDPGTPNLPYGLLPWHETASRGLRPGKDGGGWLQTPLPNSSVTKIERKADLKLSEDGALEGNVTVTYSGLQAFEMRREGRDEDEASRKKILEEELQEVVPVAADIEVTRKPDWNGSAPTFVVEYTMKVQGWMAGAGRRALMPVGLFSANEKHVFEHANRVYPVYFHYPYLKIDDVSIALPLGWKVGDLPKPIDQDGNAIAYANKSEDAHGTVHIVRKVRMDVMTVDKEHYPILRNFFQFVRSGDEQQIVLQPI